MDERRATRPGARPGAPGLARTDTLRIAPIRRTATSKEAWGLHSVPGLLSDFQRHTSHSTSQVLTQSPQSNWLGSVAAILALCTGILATKYLASVAGVLATGSLVTGIILVLSGLLMLVNRSPRSSEASIHSARFSIGLAALVCSSIYLSQIVVSAVIIVAVGLNSTGTTPSLLLKRKFLVPGLIWGLGLLAHSFFTSQTLDHGSLLAIPSLAYLFWLLSFKGDVPLDPLANLALGSVLLVVTFINSSPSVEVSSLAGISSGAFGVFLVAKRDVAYSRFNGAAAAVISALISAISGVRDFWAVPVASMSVLLPSVIETVSGRGVHLESTRAVSSSWSILDSILAHADTRSIFYFFLLNFCFMLVQLLYSILSHSLGLLSDSIHMFFDCLALLVGLVASILAKFPPSSRFPYGLALAETVSGFANGCLLLVISIGIVVEALDRIHNPIELQKITELIVVSICGLLVNLVGLFAFQHGHSHGHSHGGHSHGHNSAPAPKSNGHSHGSGHDHGHTHGHEHSHASSHAASHSAENHESDNMHGIFLHIMADTLGSVGVIISTLLTYFFGWHGFDPIASILISVLIFASAIPLVVSSAKTLLLSLNDTQEYDLRDVLNDISTTSGVTSYTVPKFWADGEGIRGTLHVQYTRGANSSVVRDKVEAKLKIGGIDSLVIQMEEEGAPCWCLPKQ